MKAKGRGVVQKRMKTYKGSGESSRSVRTLKSPPTPLINFWIFKSHSKKIEQCNTYLSIRNSIKSNKIDFSNVFVFNVIFK